MRYVFIIYLLLWLPWLIRCEGRLFRVLWLLHEVLVCLNRFYSILIEKVRHRLTVFLWRKWCVFWLRYRLRLGEAYRPSFLVVFTGRFLSHSSLLIHEGRMGWGRITFEYKQVGVLLHYHALITELTIRIRFKPVRLCRFVGIKLKLGFVDKLWTLIRGSFKYFTFLADSWKGLVV